MNQRSTLSFAAIREEFDLTETFPDQVMRAAERATDRFPDDRVDARDIEFVTVDPQGSLDLDQAVCIQRTETGYLLNYAIADVGAFVTPGDAIDREVRERGQTIYLPDGNVPLHPRILSEDRASLVAGEDRPAVLWQIETDASGHLTRARVRRATVHVRERLDYETLQRRYDRAEPLHPVIELLPEWGRLREQLARTRGAIELQLPEQDLAQVDGKWRLRLEPRTAMDGWNAQCSLATGMAAAEMMLAARVGIVRTLPAPDAETVEQFRDVARGFGIEAAADAKPGEILASLEPGSPVSLALNTAATKLLRGAGYTVFDGEAPNDAWHAGVGARYAHATAPLRRLVDRYANELCLLISDGEWLALPEASASTDRTGPDPANADVPATFDPARIPDTLRDDLTDLPEIMRRSGRLASDVDNAAINLGEAVALEHRVGETFEAVLLRDSDEKHAAEIYVFEPPVIAQCTGEVPAARRILVRCTEADPSKERVRFTYPASIDVNAS